MRKFILLLTLSISIKIINAQVPNWLWAQNAGGNSAEESYSIASDANGNVYVTGRFASSSITFGSITLTNADPSGNTFDFFLVKYDPVGNVIWAKNAGGAGYDWGQSVATDPNGNIYVIGLFYSSSISFGSTILTNVGSSDLFIVKYNSGGNVIWAKSAVSTGNDYGYGISADASENVYVTGSFTSSSITFDFMSINNLNPDTTDIFIVKFNGSGNVLWAKSAGGVGGDNAYSISNDASGNLYVTGRFFSSLIIFDSMTLTNSDTSGNTSDIFLVKYDSSGNIDWAEREGGMKNDKAISVTTEANGNVYITGQFISSSITFGSTTIINSGNYDFFLVKYDSSGNVLWAKTATGSGGDGGVSVSTDVIGNVFVAGIFLSSFITFNSTTLTNSGWSNIFLIKYDGSGNVLWAKSAGGSSDDWCWGSATDYNGNVYITGSFSSASLTFGSTTLINTYAPSYDIFVAKVDGVTGIKDDNSYYAINLFPNPNNGKFLLQADNLPAAKIKIYNIIGEIIFQSSDKKLEIDLSRHPKGIYSIEIITQDKSFIKKLIVQ